MCGCDSILQQYRHYLCSHNRHGWSLRLWALCDSIIEARDWWSSPCFLDPRLRGCLGSHRSWLVRQRHRAYSNRKSQITIDINIRHLSNCIMGQLSLRLILYNAEPLSSIQSRTRLRDIRNGHTRNTGKITKGRDIRLRKQLRKVAETWAEATST